MTQDLLRAFQGHFPEEAAKQRSRGPVAKTCRGDYPAAARLQRARGARGELGQAGSSTHPKHCRSPKSGTHRPATDFSSRAQKQEGLPLSAFLLS